MTTNTESKATAAITGVLEDLADAMTALAEFDDATREFITARTAAVRRSAKDIRKLNVAPRAVNGKPVEAALKQ